jgi:splicing factor 3B subunit 3
VVTCSLRASSATSESAAVRHSRSFPILIWNHVLTDCSGLYHFQGLGDNEADEEWISANYQNNGMTDEPLPFAYFTPRPLENLLLTDSMDSLDPVTDAKVMNLMGIASDTPQILAACGRGTRSTFRTLRHGLDVQELVNSGLPGTPNAVWTVKVNEAGES